MGLSFARLKDKDGKFVGKAPERAGKREAGVDFYIPDNFEDVYLTHGQSILIPMGVKVCLPEVPDCLKGTHEYMLQFINKSGTAYKKGLVVGSCVIDTTYQGQLFLNLHKNTVSVSKDGVKKDNDYAHIQAGENIIQGVLILVNIEEIEEKDEAELYEEATQRGDQGFGSKYKEQ